MRREPAKTLYESLTTDEQAVMRVLAVFGKAVPELAVRFLLPELNIEAILLELETTYAVQFNDKGDTYTYTLRPIDQEYAYGQLTEDERQDLHSKAAAFYRELRTPEESWKRLEDVQPQLDEFEQFVRAKDYDAACDLLTDIDHGYLTLWGHVVLVRDLHLQLLNRVSEMTLKSNHLNNLGLVYRSLGEVHRAIECFEQALEIAREIHNRRNEGAHLGNLGSAYHDLGEVHRAIEYQKQALEIAREIHNRRNEGNCLNRLGIAHHNLGEIHRAIEYHEQALEIAREIHDRVGEGVALSDLGSAYSDLGDLKYALQNYQEGLTIVQEVNYREGESEILSNLGLAFYKLGDLENAISHCKDALVIACSAGHRRIESSALDGLGLVYCDLGELDKMLTCGTVALTIFDAIESPKAEDVAAWLWMERHERADFDGLVRSLFPNGDNILNEATGQNYTFFRDAPADMPDRILALIDQYVEDREENEPHDNPNS
jgi:tetratricopeptide (TPR) repeat protein